MKKKNICPVCKGTRYIITKKQTDLYERWSNHTVDVAVKCSACGGSGELQIPFEEKEEREEDGFIDLH